MREAIILAGARSWATLMKDQAISVYMLCKCSMLTHAPKPEGSVLVCDNPWCCTRPRSQRQHAITLPHHRHTPFLLPEKSQQSAWEHQCPGLFNDTLEAAVMVLSTEWTGPNIARSNMVWAGKGARYILGIPPGHTARIFTDSAICNNFSMKPIDITMEPCASPKVGAWEGKEHIFSSMMVMQYMRHGISWNPKPMQICTASAWEAAYGGVLSPLTSPVWQEKWHTSYLDWSLLMAAVRYVVLFTFVDTSETSMGDYSTYTDHDKPVEPKVLDPMLIKLSRDAATSKRKNDKMMANHIRMLQLARKVLVAHQKLTSGQELDGPLYVADVHFHPKPHDKDMCEKTRLPDGTKLGVALHSVLDTAWLEMEQSLFINTQLHGYMTNAMPYLSLSDGQWVLHSETRQHIIYPGLAIIHDKVKVLPDCVRSDEAVPTGERTFMETLCDTSRMIVRKGDAEKVEEQGVDLTSMEGSAHSVQQWCDLVEAKVWMEAVFDVVLAGMSPVEWWLGATQAPYVLPAGSAAEESVREIAQLAYSGGTLQRHDHVSASKNVLLHTESLSVSMEDAPEREGAELALDAAWVGADAETGTAHISPEEAAHITVYNLRIRPAYTRRGDVPHIFPVTENMATVGARYDSFTNLGWSLLPASVQLDTCPSMNMILPRVVLDEWALHLLADSLTSAASACKVHQMNALGQKIAKYIRQVQEGIASSPRPIDAKWTTMWFHTVWRILRLTATEEFKKRIRYVEDLAVLALQKNADQWTEGCALVAFMRPTLCRVFTMLEAAVICWGNSSTRGRLRQFVATYMQKCDCHSSQCPIMPPFPPKCRVLRCIHTAHAVLESVHPDVRPVARALFFSLFPFLSTAEAHYVDAEIKSAAARAELLEEEVKLQTDKLRAQQQKAAEKEAARQALQREVERKEEEARLQREEAERRVLQREEEKKRVAAVNRERLRLRKKEAEARREMAWEDMQAERMRRMSRVMDGARLLQKFRQRRALQRWRSKAREGVKLIASDWDAVVTKVWSPSKQERQKAPHWLGWQPPGPWDVPRDVLIASTCNMSSKDMEEGCNALSAVTSVDLGRAVCRALCTTVN